MYRFEVLFTLFMVTQPTLGTAYIPGKIFNPRKYADVNQVARRDCVPAAPNVSASAIITDACRQNNHTDPTTCSDEIAKSIQQSRTSTCNVYSNLYNACKSSNNGSSINCSDSLLGYQECSNYTLQAYAYCGCYYSLPTELSSCANEQLQNQTAGSIAVPMSSTSSIQAATLVPPPIIPIGPATPPPQTPVLTTIQPAHETNSTSRITIVSTMYLPIGSSMNRLSDFTLRDPGTINPPQTPVPTDGTRTIITTFSILEPASTGPITKTPTTSSHPTFNLPIPPLPPSPPTLSTETLTLTLLTTVTINPSGSTPSAPSIYISTYTSTILTTISYTPTPSPSTTVRPSSNLDPPPTITTTISITETTTIFTNLINEPINTVAPFTIVGSRSASAIGSAVPPSGVVAGGGGGGAGNRTAPFTIVNSGTASAVAVTVSASGVVKSGGGGGGGGGSQSGPGGWCPRCQPPGRRKKRSRILI